MPLNLLVDSFGAPRGVVEGANPGLLEKGIIRRATNGMMDGLGRLRVRGGTRVAVTLLDENDDPVDTVCAVVPFRDGALAAGWSQATGKVYLYEINAEMTTATRVVPGTGLDYLWSGVTEPPVVWIAEGLDAAYIAHGEAADEDTLAYPSRVWEPKINTLWFLNADLDNDTSDEATYFSGFVSYHSHLVGWGFDMGTTAATGYRPEYLRIGAPNFGALLSSGGYAENGQAAFSVGNRVRSARERILAACVSGDVCYVASSFALHALTGYGRDSWQVSTLDSSLGVVSSRAMCDVSGTLYYWSPRGPARVQGLGKPEPLWDALPETVATIANPHRIVAAYDQARDLALFVHGRPSSDSEVRAIAAYDIRRDVWLGPDGLLGTEVFCIGTVTPITPATVEGDPPTGPPTLPVTDSVTATTATVSVTAGDERAGTDTLWTLLNAAGTVTIATQRLPSTTETVSWGSLTPSTGYRWNARHIRNGIASTATGDVQFTTDAGGPGGGGGGGEGPLGPPTDPISIVLGTNLAATYVTPGDTQSGTDTIWNLYLTFDSSLVETRTVPSSYANVLWSGLTPATSYYWNAKHVRNGVESAATANDTFITS